MNVHKKIKDGFREYDNWRYLENVKGVYTDTLGGMINRHKLLDRRLMALLGTYYAVTFPNLDIMEFLNTNFPKGRLMMEDGINEPSYCKRCCGAGKFDWVSDITGPSHLHSRYEFIRDKRVVLLYLKSNGDLSTNKIWAPTEVHTGERICDGCLGTGINLEWQGFMSYRDMNLRKSLTLYDIRHFL